MLLYPFYEPQKLLEIAETNKLKYAQADPFPHIVIDNLFDQTLLTAVESKFPEPNSQTWYRYDNVLEKKLATNRLLNVDPLFRQLFQELNSIEFIQFLENLTGIKNLIPDPGLNGGGLHQSIPGGKLDIHLDYNYHPFTKLDRRVNILIFLNKEWEDTYGGCLELWNKDMSEAKQKILPIFNRSVIFTVSDIAHHGHPEPLTCPPNRFRKSLACYYYTNGKPEEEITPPHSTVFKPRPQDSVTEEIEELRKKRAKGRLTNQ